MIQHQDKIGIIEKCSDRTETSNFGQEKTVTVGMVEFLVALVPFGIR